MCKQPEIWVYSSVIQEFYVFMFDFMSLLGHTNYSLHIISFPNKDEFVTNHLPYIFLFYSVGLSYAKHFGKSKTQLNSEYANRSQRKKQVFEAIQLFPF